MSRLCSCYFFTPCGGSGNGYSTCLTVSTPDCRHDNQQQRGISANNTSRRTRNESSSVGVVEGLRRPKLRSPLLHKQFCRSGEGRKGRDRRVTALGIKVNDKQNVLVVLVAPERAAHSGTSAVSSSARVTVFTRLSVALKKLPSFSGTLYQGLIQTIGKVTPKHTRWTPTCDINNFQRCSVCLMHG